MGTPSPHHPTPHGISAMRRRHVEPDDEDDGDDEWVPDGVYHDDEAAYVSCPHCGAEVYEDAPYCPRCETYLTREDAPADRKPTWVWVCLLLALGAALFWVVSG